MSKRKSKYFNFMDRLKEAGYLNPLEYIGYVVIKFDIEAQEAVNIIGEWIVRNSIKK